MRRAYLILILLLLAAGTAAGGASTPGSAGSSADASAAASAPCPTSSGATVVQNVRTPGRPGFLLLARNTLWVAIDSPRAGVAGRPGAVARIDTRSGRVQRVLRIPVAPYQLAYGFGSLWVTGYTTDRRYQGLLRVDPVTGRVQKVIRGPRLLGSKIATTSDAVWINGADVFPKGHSERAGVRFVYKVDPRSGTVARRVRLPAQATVIDLLAAGRSLWSVGWWGVVKLSQLGRPLFYEPIDGSGWNAALTRKAIWVAQPWFGTRPVRIQNRPAKRLLRIALSGRPRVTVIELETQPGGLAASGETVWVGANGGLARLDASATAPTLVDVPLSFVPNYLAAFPRGVWAARQGANVVSKIC